MASSRKRGPAAAASGPLSSADFIHRLPPAILRVLVSFAPLIRVTHAFLLLATWSTPYPHHSFLLVVGYALTIITAYPLLRYAPQVLVLSYVTYAWLASLRPSARSTPSSLGGARETDAAKLNALVTQLDDIADFASSLRSHLITPVISLVSWSDNPTRTKRLVIFLLTTYPAYLACYFPWADLGLPTIQLDAALPWSYFTKAQSSAVAHLSSAYHHGSAKVLQKVPGLQDQLVRLSSEPHLAKGKLLYNAHVQPHVIRGTHLLSRVTRSLSVRYVPSRLSFQLFPPFPIGSLTLQSSLLLIGIVALTWCAPWAALVRSVLWRSALLRRIVLGFVRLLSGEKGPLAAFGRGHESTFDATTGESVFTSSLIPDLVKGGKKGSTADANSVKHEDVVYEFSVYENQRWWMGLDWTSALLPQERPSWSDEHHNAVSPPSSFSLPPPKVTTTAADGKEAGSAGSTKRTVTWKWLDPEWTVAGAGYVGSIGYQPPGTTSLPSDASLIRSPTLGSDAEGGGATPTSASASSGGAAGWGYSRGEQPQLDVDEEGWSYGDNLWDKMSGKSSRGRYTRRRRWVRRAVLEIKVERNSTTAA
ncbi:hypothetical protein OC861_006545 [Tilletia horrida]|nr:hypothetical protein OC845_003184 [Tilletia horrida]KAK0559749.1 hypothetical protein OC861_006545 [Tilletia horrida]